MTNTTGTQPRAAEPRPQDKEAPLAAVTLSPGRDSNEPAMHNGKLLLLEEECQDQLAGNFSTARKWWILTVIGLYGFPCPLCLTSRPGSDLSRRCQTSMNFNAAVYSNAVEPLNEHYGINNARHGMIAFLVTYALGCESRSLPGLRTQR